MRCMVEVVEGMRRKQDVKGMLRVLEVVDVCDTPTQMGNGKCYKSSNNSIENEDRGCGCGYFFEGSCMLCMLFCVLLCTL